ncbi:MAG TPA: hypothetical protein VMT70_00210 [Vicinamibacteria bacterium]|nr:hypothetical protein [Vicinamibacteria bacterium]
MCEKPVSRYGGARTRLGGVAALAVLVGLSGCSPQYATDNSASVNLIIASINNGAKLDSDVLNGTGTGTNGQPDTTFICPDSVPVAVAVRNKNPNAPAPNVPSAVVIQSYEVRYVRTDGRAVEGVDVPYRITGQMSFSVDVATSGTSSFPLEVVRRQAKVEPPLSSIFQTAVLTVIAQVTLYGQTVSGDRVTATGALQIDFGDFFDKATSCPTTTS